MQLIKPQKHINHVLIFCVLPVALVLRVYRLSAEASFSGDELTIITRSMYSLPEIWQLTHGTPLQALWLKFWSQGLGLGYNESALYFTSTITGVLSVVVIYHLGKELFNRHVGLLCAFMLAFSAYHIYWSRSLRYYSWMVLLSSLAFLCLYRALNTNSRKAWAGYALFRTLSLYDHLSAMVIWAGEVFFTLVIVSYPSMRELWRHKSPQRGGLGWVWQKTNAWLNSGHVRGSLFDSKYFRLVLTMTIILLVFSPRGYVWVRNAYLGISNLRIPDFAAEEMAQAGPVFSNQLHIDWQTPLIILRLFDSWLFPLNTLMLISFVIGLTFCIRRRQWIQMFLVLAVMIVPFALLAIVSHTKPINGRYVISLLPLYLLMAGRGISGISHWLAKTIRLPERHRVPALWTFSAAFLVIYVGLSAPRIALTHWNVLQNWRAVGRFLGQVAQPEQLIIVHEAPSYAEALEYYLPGFNVIQHDPQLPLNSIYQSEDDFWLVFLAKEKYDEASQEVGNLGYVELIFRGGWHPDMDQGTDIRPPFSWDLIVVYVSRGITLPEDALALYEAWIPQIKDHHLRHHLTWARFYQRYGRSEMADREYTFALNEGYVNDQLAAFIFDARATTRYKIGQTEQAIADWKRAIALAGWDRRPHQHLVETYLQLGEADAAQELCQAAITAYPRESWPHVLLGKVYRFSNLDQQAISEFRKAIEIEPTNPVAYGYLGQIFANSEWSKIISLYQEARRSNPSSAWPHMQLGRFYRVEGKIKEAVVEYQQAIELQPEYEPELSGLLSDIRWDLETALGSVEVYSDQGDLSWWTDRSWVKSYPNERTVMVGSSLLTVQGQLRPHQLFLHPISDQEKTYIRFQMPDNPFAFLHVGYGLADKVNGLTNGVEYTIEVRKQGADDYESLFAQTVVQNAWQDQTISLASYWGEDLEFRLSVDSRGDYTYDWLQTIVELVPPSDPVWDLANHLTEALFKPDMLPLEWRGDGFYMPDNGRLIGRSELLVGEENLPGQVLLHPYSEETDSTLIFTLPQQLYRSLKTSFGLADEAASFSNGVVFTVSVSADSGASFTDLIQTEVTTNNWLSALVDLPVSQDLILKLNASARQDATFDWLQVSLYLLPFDGHYETKESGVTDQIPE